ncbi:SpoIIE family protein phosphatase [Frankia sp. CNm7]|uniref:SpoIIE family protein phosphatase n=1 Tax=Frankia nepalensis TaxID=1836974 RepID=A0A937RHA6_9ACTN|nr:SpoIIE family protein phosphatase [Frankia nepalensis]MBL7501273.1 SpoIIE family protein phosphatase [Frankia nepalensis]MBL7510120.1 SpoIIE family protein phosphatase [Frankia nepalensis]MBL7523859.1 SpoIIE family protein phosphatase [Frankia nepalensis]MBL7627354.1 SpoIIE family protein phosphatase [Frankia nepalensis]
MDEGPDRRAFRAGQGTVDRDNVDLDANGLYRAFSGVGIGLWDWDVASGRVLTDRAAARLLGLGDDPGPVAMDDVLARVHPDEREMVQRARDRALRTQSTFLEEYRVLRPDGSVGWVQTRAGVLVDAADGTLRVIGFSSDRTSVRTVRERVARALDHVGDIVLVLDEADTIVYANIEAVRQFGLAPQEIIGRPAAEVLLAPVRERVAELRRRRAEPAAPGKPGAATVLEIEETDRDGVWWAVRMFTIPDGLVVTMRNADARHHADTERAELIGSLSSALRRSRQLLDVTVELDQALTVDELCDAAARSAAADLGVLFTGVTLMEDDGPPRVITRPHSAFLTRAWARMPDFGPAVTAELLRTGQPRFDQNRASYLRDFPERAPNLDAMSIDAIASLPLVVSGRPIGVLLLGWPGPHTFTEEERRFLRTLVGPFAQALERARLYERQMSNVEMLQRAVLPRTLPDVDGVRLSARYLPAGRDIGIGGDWYDATVLADGTLSLVVGDVGGHGLPAVSTMAELRHAARAYALQLQAPADITTQLSANLGDQGDELLATAVVAHLDPTTGRLIWSCAGHPPPLLLAAPPGVGEPADGAGPRYLEEVHGPILGVDTAAAYGQSSVRLAPGARLLLYSDGLVERRGRSLTDRLVALAEAAMAPTPHADPADPADPDLLCDHILRAVAPSEREDDLCLLAVATG